MPPPTVSPLALGVDLGSSGLRLALIEVGAALCRAAPSSASLAAPASAPALRPLRELASPYPGAFSDPRAWRQGLIDLMLRLPAGERARISAIAIDGTSGTLLLCRSDGALLEPPLDRALAYHEAYPQHRDAAMSLLAGARGPAAAAAGSASGSLVRALELLGRAGERSAAGRSGERSAAGRAGEHGAGLLLRHQADWLMGWLLGDWRWGEEGNNLRLGWDPAASAWLGDLAGCAWAASLPRIVPSGAVLGLVGTDAAAALGLAAGCRVVAGSTDASAAVLAADPGPAEGVAVLGTTLALKQFAPAPLSAPGVSCQRLAGRWLVGGASNAGAGILRRFFDDHQIRLLSRQIDLARPSGLQLRPLPGRGERFPVDDPQLEPVLEPRPVSDALYLQALLEGLTAIEAAGWRRLRELGAPPLRRVISLGGGARNPQWRALRQQALGVPVLNRPALSAALGMALLAARMGAPSSAPAS